MKRFVILFQLYRYEFIFIHRELTPIGPPVFEWIIARLFRKKIIYDFDDAIWLKNSSQANESIVGTLKCHWKVKKIIAWSYRVSTGNDFLKDYALQFCKDVSILPTTVDLDYHKKYGSKQRETKVRIGWTGSHSTIHYLHYIDDILIRLSLEIDFEFIVISDVYPELKYPNVQFIQWNKEKEVEQLQTIDIGIMPLIDNDWSRGKCAFKAIQFMALGKPCVVSPVGANCSVVLHNVNGFHASTDDEWVSYLKLLISDQALYNTYSQRSYAHIRSNYSTEGVRNHYLALFQK